MPPPCPSFIRLSLLLIAAPLLSKSKCWVTDQISSAAPIILFIYRGLGSSSAGPEFDFEPEWLSVC